MGFRLKTCEEGFCDSIGRDGLYLTASILSLIVSGQRSLLLMSEKLKQGGTALAHQGGYSMDIPLDMYIPRSSHFGQFDDDPILQYTFCPQQEVKARV